LKEPIVVPLNNKQLIGRPNQLFVSDISRFEKDITEKIEGKRLLVYGGAGSIGKEVVKQIFKRNPAALHVIDISENNLVELVRDLRSTLGYIDGETRFLPLDMGGIETAAFLGSQPPYDYVLNLAAMKHVRSEKDEFSLMRMIKTNVIDTAVTLQSAKEMLAEKYFAVSTDKAKNPANLMGATKRIMEDILFSRSGKRECAVSTARFANVAFSDGSLLHGFR
jgi:FlaA1/EpsC-like NDP-sugar epimerase